MCRLLKAWVDRAQTSPTDPAAVAPIVSGWVSLEPDLPGTVPLRAWWAHPEKGALKGGVVVLPEIFGVNAWVRGVADRLAGWGYGALAIPLFARTAPDLCLGYASEDVLEGRSHKERTTTANLLGDVARAQRWLREQGPAGHPLATGCVGFCFGGHVAVLASALEGMAASCVCYGAGVAQGRPGGGPPALEALRQAQGPVLLIYGERDPLVPPEDLASIEAAVAEANAGLADRPIQLRTHAAGHGFLCDARGDYEPVAAKAAWQSIAAFFAAALRPTP